MRNFEFKFASVENDKNYGTSCRYEPVCQIIHGSTFFFTDPAPTGHTDPTRTWPDLAPCSKLVKTGVFLTFVVGPKLLEHELAKLKQSGQQ